MKKLSSNIDFCNLYLNWVKENIEQFKVRDNTFRITLPFLDRNNDSIEIYIIQKDDETFLMTDDGATLSDLKFGGFDINSDKRKKILDSIIASYGITKTDDNQLIVNCTMNDLALKKHMLAQCMVKVSDMFYLSRSNVQSIFIEDVQRFFEENSIRYLSNLFITGKSKLSTHYDFGIGHSKNSPERLIKVVNNMDVNAAKNIIFAWNDTKEMRQQDSQLYTIIQNSDKKVSDDAVNALKEYGIHPALWTEREKYIEELSA